MAWANELDLDTADAGHESARRIWYSRFHQAGHEFDRNHYDHINTLPTLTNPNENT